MTREAYENRYANFNAMVASIEAERAQKEEERLNHLLTEATTEEIKARLEEIGLELWGIEMADRLTASEEEKQTNLEREQRLLNKRLAEIEA